MEKIRSKEPGRRFFSIFVKPFLSIRLSKNWHGKMESCRERCEMQEVCQSGGKHRFMGSLLLLIGKLE